jgi:hypothetical protein
MGSLYIDVPLSAEVVIHVLLLKERVAPSGQSEIFSSFRSPRIVIAESLNTKPIPSS